MTASPQYKLTEEVVRQAVEVRFRQVPGWEVSFTNPTAGPWKMIRFGQYVGGDDLRFRKEEDRPDLILFNNPHRLFLVLEAKDDIRKLLRSTLEGRRRRYDQLEKSVAVFHKEFQRLDSILRNSESTALVFGGRVSPTIAEAVFVCGYIYGEGDGEIAELLAELRQAHESIVRGSGVQRLFPHLNCIVSRQSTMDLAVRATLVGGSHALKSLLEQALPQHLLVNS